MTHLVNELLTTDLIPIKQLQEVNRWGTIQLPEKQKSVEDIQELKELLQNARTMDEIFPIRETDLDLLHNHLKTKKKGKLFLLGQGTIVEYSRTPIGEIVIPWLDEDSIIDQLVDIDTYFKPAKGDGPKLVFKNAIEVFYGNKKAFILATPAKTK